jgi:hypothetical protein
MAARTNKRGLQAQQLLESHAESVVRKALVEAMKGDASLLRTRCRTSCRGAEMRR